MKRKLVKNQTVKNDTASPNIRFLKTVCSEYDGERKPFYVSFVDSDSKLVREIDKTVSLDDGRFRIRQVQVR